MNANSKKQTIDSWALDAARRLDQVSIKSSRLDVELLVATTLKKDRTWLHAHGNEILSESHMQKLEQLLARREQHEPIAYILGKKEFYGRDFLVENSVLVPRPESEAIIELALSIKPASGLRVADIGTGSGILGITLAIERPSWQVDLIDISLQALDIAQKNVTKQNVTNAEILHQDLLLNSAKNYDIVVANLPYVPDSYKQNLDLTSEPEIALFAGEDGLNAYKIFFNQLALLPKKPSHIITESLPLQHSHVAALAKACGYIHRATEGYAQHFIR